MQHLGYEPCKADPDLWMKKECQPDNGLVYYAYMLFYVDDCLCIQHDAVECLNKIDKFFHVKEGLIGDPNIYLGVKLQKVKLNNRVDCWALLPSKYVQEAIDTAEKYIQSEWGIDELPKTGSGPWPSDFVSETDESPELDPKRANYFQSLVKTMNWMVELGRVDIITETLVLALHMTMPREGHWDAVLHVLGCLKCKCTARMVFDPTYPK